MPVGYPAGPGREGGLGATGVWCDAAGVKVLYKHLYVRLEAGTRVWGKRGDGGGGSCQ
jgi:hypothetical protein